MSDLPVSWLQISLSLLCNRIVDGSHNPPKAQTFGIPMLSAKNVNNRMINFDGQRLISKDDFELEDKRTSIREGDVLLTIVATIGRVSVVGKLPPFALQRSVAVLRSTAIDCRFLAYSIESPLIQKFLMENSKGTAQKGIYLKTLGQMNIPIAPVEEQKRIADKLDTVLARVDACRERLDRIHFILKRFRQSVLAAAMSGRLTTDFRTRRVDDGIDIYPNILFGELIKSIRGGSTEVPSNENSPFPILRSSSVRQAELNTSDVKFLVSNQSKNPSNFIDNGDVLFTRLNGSVEYVGNCVVVVDVTPGTYQYPDRLFCAKLKDALDPKYCMYAFTSPNVRREIETRAKSTAGHKRISIQDVKGIKIRLPDIAEQHAIVQRVEGLFSFAHRLESRLVSARAATERLTPALLAKAFRGELVPQDPNDEPASELLKRLAAQRDAAPKLKRATKTPAI